MTYNQNWVVPSVVMPSGNKIKVGVHPLVIEAHVNARNLTALGQFAGILKHEQVLLRPLAVFKGLKRPLHEPGVDNFVFVYVSTPTCDYRYTRPNTGKPDALLRPQQSVFVGSASV